MNFSRHARAPELTAVVRRIEDVTPAEESAWLRFQQQTPAFNSPLLGPGFAKVVSSVRDDVRVAVFKQAFSVVGILAYHARPHGLARPIGSPFSDYHALLSAPDPRYEGSHALAAAGLSTFRFSSLIDPHGLFEEHVTEPVEGMAIQLRDGAQAYLEMIRARSPKRFKNLRRLESKMAREGGPVSFRGPDYDPNAFEQLLTWKGDQLKRTGLHDFLGPAWTRALLRRLFEARAGDLQGLLLTLRVDGRVVAGHFGVRAGPRYHPWIAAYDPDAAAWSPGQVFIHEAIRHMPMLELTTYDLSSGHDDYKRPFCSETIMARNGIVRSPTLGGAFGRSADLAWRGVQSCAGPAREQTITRIRNRLNQISEIELTWPGRVRGVMQAFGARKLRTEAHSVREVE